MYAKLPRGRRDILNKFKHIWWYWALKLFTVSESWHQYASRCEGCLNGYDEVGLWKKTLTWVGWFLSLLRLWVLPDPWSSRLGVSCGIPKLCWRSRLWWQQTSIVSRTRATIIQCQTVHRFAFIFFRLTSQGALTLRTCWFPIGCQTHFQPSSCWH